MSGSETTLNFKSCKNKQTENANLSPRFSFYLLACVYNEAGADDVGFVCRSRQRRPKEFCVITTEVSCYNNRRKVLSREQFLNAVILPLLVFQILLWNFSC